MVVLLFHGSTWSDPFVKDSVYFTTLFAVIYYNNWSVVDTKKFERCAYLKKAIVAKVPYSTELIALIFVYESICNHSILIS